MADLIQDFPDAIYEDASTFLFGHTPSMFLQFYYKLIILVPPLRAVFLFKHTILQVAMTMTVNERNNNVKVQLMAIHLEWKSDIQTTTDNDALQDKTGTHTSNVMKHILCRGSMILPLVYPYSCKRKSRLWR